MIIFNADTQLAQSVNRFQMHKLLEPDISPAGFPEPRTWDEIKERLLKIFTTLTEADLDFEESKRDEMIFALQAKLGKTRQEVIAIIEII